MRLNALFHMESDSAEAASALAKATGLTLSAHTGSNARVLTLEVHGATSCFPGQSLSSRQTIRREGSRYGSALLGNRVRTLNDGGREDIDR